MIGDYILHFPLTDFAVALLVVAAALDIARRALRRPQWSTTVDLLLVLGFLGAVASVASGLWLTSASEHPHDEALERHHLFAYSAAATAFVAVVARAFEPRVPRLAIAKTALLLLSAGLVSGAGFYGGRMAHPADAPHAHGSREAMPHAPGPATMPADAAPPNAPDPHDTPHAH